MRFCGNSYEKKNKSVKPKFSKRPLLNLNLGQSTISTNRPGDVQVISLPVAIFFKQFQMLAATASFPSPYAILLLTSKQRLILRPLYTNPLPPSP
jgi:hypothetical protein